MATVRVTTEKHIQSTHAPTPASLGRTVYFLFHHCTPLPLSTSLPPTPTSIEPTPPYFVPHHTLVFFMNLSALEFELRGKGIHVQVRNI